MLSLRWRGEDNLLKAIVKLEKDVETGAKGYVMASVQWLVKDIRGSWFPTSPSPKRGGTPPAKDSGNLDEQVSDSIGQGRDLLGRFAKSGNVKLATIRIDTSKGNGRDYGQALEDGTSRMAARPYFKPAVERLKAAGIWLARREFKL